MIFRLCILVVSLASCSVDVAKVEKCGSYNRYFILAEPDARCIDGSPGSYYYKKGFGSGIDKWIIFFEGGGWCYDMEKCRARSKEYLGSSSQQQEEGCDKALSKGGYLSGYKHASNGVSYNFNQVYVNYCDGGSFAGDAEVAYRGTTLHFKGSKIRRGVITDLMTRFDMAAASDVVLIGASAGGIVAYIRVALFLINDVCVSLGLAVYMGVDQIRQQIQSYNSTIDVGGLADAGFFPDFSRSFGSNGLARGNLGIRKLSSPPMWHLEEYDVEVTAINYSHSIRRVFHFMNISAGVPETCLMKHRNNPSNCMFAEHLLPIVEAPLLILQVEYLSIDPWSVF